MASPSRSLTVQFKRVDHQGVSSVQDAFTTASWGEETRMAIGRLTVLGTKAEEFDSIDARASRTLGLSPYQGFVYAMISGFVYVHLDGYMHNYD